MRCLSHSSSFSSARFWLPGAVLVIVLLLRWFFRQICELFCRSLLDKSTRLIAMSLFSNTYSTLFMMTMIHPLLAGSSFNFCSTLSSGFEVVFACVTCKIWDELFLDLLFCLVENSSGVKCSISARYTFLLASLTLELSPLINSSFSFPLVARLTNEYRQCASKKVRWEFTFLSLACTFWWFFVSCFLGRRQFQISSTAWTSQTSVLSHIRQHLLGCNQEDRKYQPILKMKRLKLLVD